MVMCLVACVLQPWGIAWVGRGHKKGYNDIERKEGRKAGDGEWRREDLEKRGRKMREFFNSKSETTFNRQKSNGASADV
jgi:hypothetical protein